MHNISLLNRPDMCLFIKFGQSYDTHPCINQGSPLLDNQINIENADIHVMWFTLGLSHTKSYVYMASQKTLCIS